MSIKLHLRGHLASFPEKLGAVSNKQDERFHQDLKVVEERYQRRWDVHMMGTIAGGSNAIVLKLNTPERGINVNVYLNYLHTSIIIAAISFVKT